MKDLRIGALTFLITALIAGSLYLFGTSTNPIPVAHASCNITSFSVSPGSPQQVGASVNISASANCGGGVRAMRILVDGSVKSEIGAPSISATWHTSGAAPGGHTITVEAAENGDNNWSNSASQSMGYELTTPPPPQCSITSFNVSPGSPQPPGTTISLSGSATCSTGVRAIRLKVNGSVINEIGAPDISGTWQAGGAGNYTLEIEAAGMGDNNWAHSASQSVGYTIQQVDPGCRVNSINASPSSPGPLGGTITISGSASCAHGSVRAMRIKVNGSIISEIGAPSISATWTAPNTPSNHTFTVEASGQGDNNWTYADSRSMNYEIGGDPRCSVDSINASPASPQSPGTTITISGSASCANGSVRAMRVRVNGSIISEIGAPSISATWTAPNSPGTHTFTVEASGQGDNNWTYADSRSMSYDIRPIDPGCKVNTINASPSSPQAPGTTITISGNASCENGSVRAMRVRVNGSIISEIGASSISATWTAPNSSGNHTFTVEAAGQGDNSWAYAGSKSMSYDIRPIDPGCRVDSINASPSSPGPPGATVTISGAASCTNGSVRAMRIKVNGSIISEIGAPSISATWTAPNSPGTHTFTVEASGQGDNNWANADSKSMNYTVDRITDVVDPGCKVNTINASPSSPQAPGTTITISGNASCENGSVRAMRVRVNGSIISEIGAPSISATWTAPNSSGNHTFTIEAAGQGDNNWAYAGSRSMNFEVRPIDPGCKVDSINASPSSPGPLGASVTISGTASCINGSVRAMRIKVNGSTIFEIGAPSISATWTAPNSPGTHSFTVEASGQGDNNWAFAGNQSMVYVVGTDTNVVDPGCSLTSLTTDPPSPQPPGTVVSIVAKGKCDKGVRAIKIKIDGQTKMELGASELRYTWESPGSDGAHRIEAEVAGIGDNQWAYAGRSAITYVLGNVPPSNLHSDSPSTSGGCRYTWAVGNQVGLSAGAEIRSGAGSNFSVHTRVPENDWLVDIVGGPRQVNGGVWFDVSRAALDGGGSGWVEFTQSGFAACAVANSVSVTLNAPQASCTSMNRAFHIGSTIGLMPGQGIYAEPNESSQLIANTLPNASAVKVLQGPLLRDGINWWRVSQSESCGYGFNSAWVPENAVIQGRHPAASIDETTSANQTEQHVLVNYDPHEYELLSLPKANVGYVWVSFDLVAKWFNDLAQIEVQNSAHSILLEGISEIPIVGCAAGAILQVNIRGLDVNLEPTFNKLMCIKEIIPCVDFIELGSAMVEAEMVAQRRLRYRQLVTLTTAAELAAARPSNLSPDRLYLQIPEEQLDVLYLPYSIGDRASAVTLRVSSILISSSHLANKTELIKELETCAKFLRFLISSIAKNLPRSLGY